MKNIFTEMLLVDVVRGHHSTGAALVKRYQDEVILEKAPVPSPMFISTKEYKDFIDTIGVKALIGHNRYATVGEKNAANAHPFQCGHIVGAHNGTLDTWRLKELPEYENFGTDSEALFNSASKLGIKETMAKLTGAWALSWYDTQSNSINLLRNHKRPLYYAYSLDRATVFWASEANMLEWILTRNHVKIFGNEIYACEVDRHYRWFVPEKLGTPFDKPLLTEVKERTFSNVRNFSWQGHSYQDAEEPWNFDQATGAYGGGTYSPSLPFVPQSPPAQVAQKATKKINTKKFRPPYRDVYGHTLNKTKFQELVVCGCLYCDKSESIWGDFIHPMKDDMDGRKLYLCEACYNDDDIREMTKQII